MLAPSRRCSGWKNSSWSLAFPLKQYSDDRQGFRKLPQKHEQQRKRNFRLWEKVFNFCFNEGITLRMNESNSRKCRRNNKVYWLDYNLFLYNDIYSNLKFGIEQKNFFRRIRKR